MPPEFASNEISPTGFSPEFNPTPEQEQTFTQRRARIEAQLPELTAGIATSLQTPQIGTDNKYHNEGPTMRSHLTLMSANLDNILAGRFIADFFSEEEQNDFHQFATDNQPLLEQFIFLHDIEKPNCLQFKFKDPHGGQDIRVEVSWEDWLRVQSNGQPYRFTNPKTGQTEQISDIAYFHTNKPHGQAAALKLANQQEHPRVDPRVLPLIAFHDVAFKFANREEDGQPILDSGINTKIVAKFIEENPGIDQQLNQLFLVNYLDLASSLRQNGQPDFTCLQNFMTSYHNHQLIHHHQPPLNQHDTFTLYKSRQKLTEESINKHLIELHPINRQHIQHQP